MNIVTINAPDPNSFEYLIGYVNKFDFHDPHSKKIFEPHPLPGRVYPILKDENGYVLHIGDLISNTTLKGIWLGDSLITSDPKWDFEVTLVDKENMLDLDISYDDLKKVSEWLDTKHQSLKDSLIKKPSQSLEQPPNIQDLLPKKLQDTLVEENKRNAAYIDLSNNLSVLVEKDPEMLQSLCVLVNYLSHKTPSLTLRSYISSSEAPEAMIGAAMSSLETYDETMEPVAVLKTIETCLYEVQKYY